MLKNHQELILSQLTNRTGASVGVEVDGQGVQSGVTVWFSDLGRSASPQVHMAPSGLDGFTATLSFGNFTRNLIDALKNAEETEKKVARDLINLAAIHSEVKFVPDQELENWVVTGPEFSIVVKRRGLADRFSSHSILKVCDQMVAPLLTAFAELVGYKSNSSNIQSSDETIKEGAVTLALVKRRERNPKNRLLCILTHGETCKACGTNLKDRYGLENPTIDVHHIHPLALMEGEREFDAAIDLVPLCPNCHRVAHTRKPIPWSVEDIKEKLRGLS